MNLITFNMFRIMDLMQLLFSKNDTCYSNAIEKLTSNKA